MMIDDLIDPRSVELESLDGEGFLSIDHLEHDTELSPCYPRGEADAPISRNEGMITNVTHQKRTQDGLISAQILTHDDLPIGISSLPSRTRDDGLNLTYLNGRSFEPSTIFPSRLPLPAHSTSIGSTSTSYTPSETISTCSFDERESQRPYDLVGSSIRKGYVERKEITLQTDSRSKSSSVTSGATNFTYDSVDATQFDLEALPTPTDPNDNEKKNTQFWSKMGKKPKELFSYSVDELLANDLNRLSFQQRESINEEIHGVDVRNSEAEKTPELLRASLSKLDQQLSYLRSENFAFDRAQRLFGTITYLNTDELRLMFLRADLFDCDKAAKRLCKYTQMMYEIFGDIGLERRPCLSDFNDLELEVIKSGGYQVLPGRDRAGRRILGNLAFDPPKNFGVKSRLRCGIYFILSVLDDIETQRKGVVALSWWHNITVNDFITRAKVHEKLRAMPLRIGAMHCCLPSDDCGDNKARDKDRIASGMSQIVKAMLILSIGAEIRPHFRIHSGSVIECIYSLQSFGIHPDQIPVSGASGKLKTKEHLKWIELCRLKEDPSIGAKIDRFIECPNQTDVLFGRGRPIMRHPGNATLRMVVQSMLPDYAGAKSKKEATEMTWAVVRIMKGKFGARFLKEANIDDNEVGWVEVSNETARLKIRIAFRDLRAKNKKTPKEPKAGSSSESGCGDSNAVDQPNAKRKVSLSRTRTEGSPGKTPSSICGKNSVSGLINESGSGSTSVFLDMDGASMKRQRCDIFEGWNAPVELFLEDGIAEETTKFRIV